MLILDIQTSVIDLGLQKVFDKVPHRRLIMKLAAHRVGDNILHWIENWLSDRKQSV